LDSVFSSNVSLLQCFIHNMYLSNKYLEQWYGDTLKADKMGGDDLKETFHCNLELLDLNRNYIQTNFVSDRYKKRINIYKDHTDLIFTKMTKLKHLYMSYSNVKVADLECYLTSFEEKKSVCPLESWDLSHNPVNKAGALPLSKIIELSSTIKALDISHCLLGVAGAYAITDALAKNASIQYLQMFANKIDVDGARSLGKALMVNKTL
jgi:hypothetical protein